MNIHITSDPISGITYAEDMSLRGGRAMAICHPNDMFDEEIGIKLALKRVLEGAHIGDNVIVDAPLYLNPFLPFDMANYIINYHVFRLDVLPGSFLDRIDKGPVMEKGNRPVQYRFIYETVDGYAIVENRLTEKIAVTQRKYLIRA